MKRRNFLTLFPIAGFAAAFGIKLKAEPKFQIPDVKGVVLKGIPTEISEMNFSDKYSASSESSGYGKIYYKKDYPELYEACFPDD